MFLQGLLKNNFVNITLRVKFLNLFFLLFLSLSVSVSSQVLVSKKIILNGEDSLNRTVSGIAFPEKSSNATNAAGLQTSQLIYAKTEGTGNMLDLTIIPAILQYVPGMVINFKISEKNTGPVKIRLSNLPFMDLRKNGIIPLDSFDLDKGLLVTAIFDGDMFQVISPLNRKCPDGFASVNKDFCIQVKEVADTVDWFIATKTCGDMGARLCTQSEWVYACQKTQLLNLINIFDNTEWIDTAGNSVNEAKAMGVDFEGNHNCRSGQTAPVSNKNTFRCCYSR